MFMTRLMSSVVLVVLALVTILSGGYLLAAVLFFLAVIAFGELMNACKLTGGIDRGAGACDGNHAVGWEVPSGWASACFAGWKS